MDKNIAIKIFTLQIGLRMKVEMEVEHSSQNPSKQEL